MDQKSTILRIINQQYQKIFAIFFFQYKSHVHVSMKVNILTFYKGVLGQQLPEANEIKKKIKRNGGFSFQVRFFKIIFYFWA